MVSGSGDLSKHTSYLYIICRKFYSVAFREIMLSLHKTERIKGLPSGPRFQNRLKTVKPSNMYFEMISG